MCGDEHCIFGGSICANNRRRCTGVRTQDWLSYVKLHINTEWRSQKLRGGFVMILMQFCAILRNYGKKKLISWCVDHLDGVHIKFIIIPRWTHRMIPRRHFYIKIFALCLRRSFVVENNKTITLYPKASYLHQYCCPHWIMYQFPTHNIARNHSKAFVSHRKLN